MKLFERDENIQQWILKPEQYELIKKICSRPYGLIQLPTGYGKNVLITYLVTHYIGSGNILIVVPTKSIGEEVLLRFRQCGIININENRIKYVQASGFVASNYFKTDECNNFLKDVEMILVDEAENVTSSLDKIIEKCSKVKIFYGFSATSDRFNNLKLDYNTIKNRFNELHEETSNLMYYFGTTLVYKSAEKLINVYQTYLPIPPEEPLSPWMQMQAVPKAVDNVIKSNSFLKYFKYIKKEFPNKVLFVPVKTIEQGEYLLKHCESLKYKAVFWSGNEVKSTNNISELNIKKYEDIKENANKYNIQVIISTTVGFKGIDIKAITDILLVIGTNASVVNQIIGRAYRSDEDIRLWLLYNDNDRYIDWRKHTNELSTPVYNACNGARMKQIIHAQKYNLKTININCPLSNQDKIKEEKVNNDLDNIKDKELINQSKIFDTLRKSYKPKNEA